MIRNYNIDDLEVVEEGIAFPQENSLDTLTGADFFGEQTY